MPVDQLMETVPILRYFQDLRAPIDLCVKAADDPCPSRFMYGVIECAIEVGAGPCCCAVGCATVRYGKSATMIEFPSALLDHRLAPSPAFQASSLVRASRTRQEAPAHG